MKFFLLITSFLCTLSNYPMETAQAIPGSVELQTMVYNHVIELREQIMEREDDLDLTPREQLCLAIAGILVFAIGIGLFSYIAVH